MKWSVTVPGNPPSTNHAYHIVQIRRSGGVPFRTLAKTDEAVTYQKYARLIVAAAKPSGWEPGPQIRLRYRLYLSGRQDADNSLKFLNDAIARAIGVNDWRFLPAVESKELVKPSEARVEIEIE